MIPLHWKWRLRCWYWKLFQLSLELPCEYKPSGYLAVTRDGDYAGAYKTLHGAVLVNNKNPDNRKCTIIPFWTAKGFLE